MQVYVLNPDPKESAKILWERSPKRARSQLKEGLQMIAAHPSYEPPLRADVQPYSRYWMRHRQTKWVIENHDNFWWTVEFLHEISKFVPDHACTESLNGWLKENGLQSFKKLPEFKYFGSWDAPGRSVYEKYLSYLREKIARMG